MYKSKKFQDSPFNDKFTIRMSELQLNEMKLEAKRQQVSLRTLFMRAFYNELKRDDGFQFDSIAVDIREYDQEKHGVKKIALKNFIKRYPALSLEDLIYLIPDMPEVENEKELLLCFWELFDKEIIVEKKIHNMSTRGYQPYEINPFPPERPTGVLK